MESSFIKILTLTLPLIVLKGTLIQGMVFSTDEFTKLVTEQPEYLVDKSLIINELLLDRNQLISIIRPKSWGKGFNLHMIREFLQVKVDYEGAILVEEEKINSKFFFGGEIQINLSNKNKTVERKLEPLKIAKIWNSFEHKGKYPVLWLDLEYLKYCLYPEMELCLKIVISNIFHEHLYLKKYYESENNDALIDLGQKIRLQRYYMGNVTTEDLSQSLRFLSEILYKHFNRKVYVLVNDYDSPFILYSTYPQGLRSVYLNASSLLRELFCQTFNDNPYLEKAIFTATLPMFEAQSELLGYLHNFTQYTLLDNKYSEYYGFTRSEVDQLIVKTGSKIDRFQFDDLYYGYSHGKEIVYNPWSVLQHLMFGSRTNLNWLETVTLPKNIDKFISEDKWYPALRDLFTGYGTICTVDTFISIGTCNTSSCLCSFLLYSGYLNVQTKLYSNRTYLLTIPNEELKEFYAKKIMQRVKTKLFVDLSVGTYFMDLLSFSMLDGFEQKFQQFVSSIGKFIEMKPITQESYFYDLMLLLIDRLSPKYKMNFQIIPPLNETIAVLIPKVDGISNVIFMGFKYMENFNNLTSTAANILQHVNSLKYDVTMGNRTRVLQIVRIGIVFSPGCCTAVKYNVELLCKNQYTSSANKTKQYL